MNTQNFIKLLNNENAVASIELKQLDSVLENFPYFQSARMLYLKNLKIHNNFLFNSYLRTTASYVADRTVLFEYITQTTSLPKTEHIVLEESDLQKKIQQVDDVKEKIKKEIIGIIENTKEETPTVINFSSNDKFSFNEWLQLSNVKEISRKHETEIKTPKKIVVGSKTANSKFDLIDKFININPKLRPKAKENIASENIALSGTVENEGWMTETLAQVYIEQKKYSKAIKTYKILGLKYPEKSGFFADRIRSIKKLSEY